MKTFTVTKIDENQRVDKYIMKLLGNASKGFIYKMFRKKNIKLNGQKIEGHEIVKAGDVLEVYFSDDTFESFKTSQVEAVTHKRDFDVLFEDENVLVCHKPVGLLSQPDGEGDSLVQQIEGYLMQKEGLSEGHGFKPGICNRLDRNTSGIVLSGKNVPALQSLNHAIAHRQVKKYYLTLVKGIVEEPNTLKGYLYKDEMKNQVRLVKEKGQGDYIETIYRPLAFYDQFTLLEVQIITGKSHQIRLHLSSISHPIVGDTKYGDLKTNLQFQKRYGLKHQLLHAYKVVIMELQDPLGYLNGQEWVKEPNGIFKRILDDFKPRNQG